MFTETLGRKGGQISMLRPTTEGRNGESFHSTLPKDLVQRSSPTPQASIKIWSAHDPGPDLHNQLLQGEAGRFLIPFTLEPLPKLQQDLRNGDAYGTDFVTGSAQGRRKGMLGSFTNGRQQWSQHGPKRSLVSCTIGMPANRLIDRTNIQAGLHSEYRTNSDA